MMSGPYLNTQFSDNNPQYSYTYASNGTSSSTSTASPQELSQATSSIYSNNYSIDTSVEKPVQPLIPFTFEAPTRSRRRRRSKQTSSSTKEDQPEDFDFPQPRTYQINSPGTFNMSKTERDQIISALRNNQIKTLVELRRIERSFINSGDREIRDAISAAWGYYVNSNNLLNELRTLTRSYPFASECLDEAKWKVIEDPNSSRSWNYCWLVLVKVQNDGLIAKHANWMASKPEMWGNTRPNAGTIAQLAANFSTEWTRAITQLLRHWETPPTVTGA